MRRFVKIWVAAAMPLCVDCADKAETMIARIKRKGLEAGGVLAIQVVDKFDFEKLKATFLADLYSALTCSQTDKRSKMLNVLQAPGNEYFSDSRGHTLSEESQRFVCSTLADMEILEIDLMNSFNKVKHDVCGYQIVQSQLEFSSDQYFDCGNHADIFMGIYGRVNRVAVKMSKNGIEKNNDISLQHESYVLEKLVGCNHIVSKKDYFQTFRKFGVRSEALILQFIQGTNLNDYLHASGGHGPVSECNARMLCAQLLQAAHFMHARGIVHRDLQPSNVMLSQDELGRSHLTVIDFNLATISSNVDEPNIVCSHGTSGYRPPEVLAGQPSGPAVDIWAIGVILYEMITCDYHMKDVRETEAQFHQRLPQGIEENNDLSDDLKDILIAMLQNDPTKRPTAKDLLESHPWIHHVEIQNGLTIDTAIGQGLYAQVSRAKLNGATVAVKIQKRNANSQNSLANENAHLEKLDFPNIVKPQAYFENALGQEMLVLEYVEGRQLGEYLFSENRSLTEMEVKPFAVQLLGALEHMHSHDVVHRDLHMGNVLISNDAVNLTVIDFNLASDSKPHTGAGILAPEVRLGRPSGPPVDVWSVGLLVLEMLVGRAKFGNEYNVSADSSLITRSNLSDQCQDFLRRMLQQNPEERPTASTLLEHPWIQNSELAAI